MAAKQYRIIGKPDNVFQLKLEPSTHSSPSRDSELLTIAHKLNYGRSKKSKWFWFGKRLFDKIASTTLLIVLSPLFLIIAIAMKLEGKGPIFFFHERVGERFKLFKVVKFRTMHTGVSSRPQPIFDEESKRYRRPSVEEDKRITAMGKFLRQWSLDELPQLINIFKGDMSFVGPRPLSVEESLPLPNDFLIRYSVPAGLTGLAQISDRGKSMELDRFDKDFTYIENLGLKQEVRIFLKTFHVIHDKY